MSIQNTMYPYMCCDVDSLYSTIDGTCIPLKFEGCHLHIPFMINDDIC